LGGDVPGLAQIPFIINVFWSIKHGEKVKNDNPWNSTTLEWQTPTPPPHGNFTRADARLSRPLRIQRSRPRTDFTPQNEPPERPSAPRISTAH
jgi:cytochrome c oxidase subunit 1